MSWLLRRWIIRRCTSEVGAERDLRDAGGGKGCFAYALLDDADAIRLMGFLGDLGDTVSVPILGDSFFEGFSLRELARTSRIHLLGMLWNLHTERCFRVSLIVVNESRALPLSMLIAHFGFSIVRVAAELMVFLPRRRCLPNSTQVALTFQKGPVRQR